MDKKKITFKQVWDNQNNFVRTGKTGNYLYRKLSVPFTYLFINLSITPNTITILQYFLCIFGFVFLVMGTYKTLIIGLVFYILFYNFDSADGDVARTTNQKSIEGIFFDEISHYFFAVFLGTGLGIGLAKIYQNELYLILGVSLSMAIAVECAIIYSLRSTYRKGIIDEKISKSDDTINNKLYGLIYNKRSWGDGNIFVKIFGVLPFNGLLFSFYNLAPILIALAIIELFTSIVLIPIYLTALVLAKTIWIFAFLYKMNKNRYITKVIMH